MLWNVLRPREQMFQLVNAKVLAVFQAAQLRSSFWQTRTWKEKCVFKVTLINIPFVLMHNCFDNMLIYCFDNMLIGRRKFSFSGPKAISNWGPLWKGEMAVVTFLHIDSAPVPDFFNPGLKNFQVWESDSCTDSGYHKCNRNSAMFLLKKWHA